MFLVPQSCLTLCDHMEPSRLLYPWDFLGKNTGSRILPFSPPGDLPHPVTEPVFPMSPALQQILYPLSYQGSPTFFILSLNLSIRSSRSEPQSAPSLVFADCIELLHFGCKDDFCFKLYKRKMFLFLCLLTLLQKFLSLSTLPSWASPYTTLVFILNYRQS